MEGGGVRKYSRLAQQNVRTKARLKVLSLVIEMYMRFGGVIMGHTVHTF